MYKCAFILEGWHTFNHAAADMLTYLFSWDKKNDQSWEL